MQIQYELHNHMSGSVTVTIIKMQLAIGMHQIPETGLLEVLYATLVFTISKLRSLVQL